MGEGRHRVPWPAPASGTGTGTGAGQRAAGDGRLARFLPEEAPLSVYKLPLVLEPQAEGGYVVTCPLLPELVTEGETVQDALANAHDALLAVIEAFADLGRPLPKYPVPEKVPPGTYLRT